MAAPLLAGACHSCAVRPDGTRVDLPDVRTALGGGHRFLPNGTGLVYVPRSQPRDFWLLDFASNKTRALTRLSDRGRIQTFDITPDGKEIVFDRIRAEFGHRPDRSAEVRHPSAPRYTRTEKLQPRHSYQPTIWPRGTRAR